MRSFMLAFVLALVGCSSNPKGEKPDDPGPGSGVECGGTTCVPPATCINVVGQMPQSARQECWIQCGEDKSCPDGMTCEMIHDGPGQVCIKPDPE